MERKQFVTPEYVTAEDIKRVRKQLGLTQKDFAGLLNCAKSTVERWEAGNEPVSGPIVLLLQMMEKHPEYVDEISVPEKAYTLRLWYMHEQTVCTVIDVDEIRRAVRIVNYVTHPMFRAFGVEEHPDYEKYMEFLESRCFPRSRDKLKLQLQQLDIPFYDPFLIIEKTEGRMAEDHFWIRIER